MIRFQQNGETYGNLGTFGDDNLKWGSSLILHSSNYTNYCPTKTGSGASGTWGISITGDSATVGGKSSSDFVHYRYIWEDQSTDNETWARTNATNYPQSITYNSQGYERVYVSMMNSNKSNGVILKLDHNGPKAHLMGRLNNTWTAWKELCFTDHTHSYLPLSGGNLTGPLTLVASGNNIASFQSVASIGVVSLKGNGTYGTRLDVNNLDNSETVICLDYTGYVTAKKFIKSGGTSSQFLKADGSVDSSSYALSSHTHSYLPLSGGTLTGKLNVYSTASDNTEYGSYLYNYVDSNSIRHVTLVMDPTNPIGVNSDYIQLATTSDGNSFLDVPAVGIFTLANTMYIKRSGNVGIGTNNPAYKLDVSGSLNATTLYQNGTQVSVSGHTHSYLPLAGGTMTGQLTLSGGKIVKFTNGNTERYLGHYDTKGDLSWYNGSSWYKVWHEGNDGSGSGLDADKLCGYRLENFMTFAIEENYVNASFPNYDFSAKAHQKYIEFWDGGGREDTGWYKFRVGEVRAVDGGLYVGNNAVIHAGNIASQSVSHATSADSADTLDTYHASDILSKISGRNLLKQFISAGGRCTKEGNKIKTTPSTNQGDTYYYIYPINDLPAGKYVYSFYVSGLAEGDTWGWAWQNRGEQGSVSVRNGRNFMIVNHPSLTTGGTGILIDDYSVNNAANSDTVYFSDFALYSYDTTDYSIAPEETITIYDSLTNSEIDSIIV